MIQKHLTKGWDYPSFARLLVMMVAIGLYLGITHWADDLESITLLIILSCIIGFVVGYSTLSKTEVILFSILICIVFILIFLGFTLDGQFNYFDRIFSVLYQIGHSVNQLLHNQPLENPMFFLFSISTGFWLIGFYSSFSLVRSNNPWISIWLGAASLIMIDLFVPTQNKNWFLTATFFLFTLLLLSRLFFNQRKLEWEKTGVFYEPNSKLDFNGSIILVSTLIIILAWFIPVITNALTPGTTEQERVRNYFSNLSDRLNNVFAPLNKMGEEAYVQNGSILNIGNSIGSDEQELFSIESSRLAPSGFRFYWRARAYDYYEGKDWSTSDYSQVTYASEATIQEIPQGQTSQLFTFTFLSSKRLGIYFTSGNLILMDRPGEMLYFRGSENRKDLIAAFPLQLMQANETYTIQSIMEYPTQEQLIASGNTYPEWVKKLYLQLPENLPARLITLANEITEGMTNPYEKSIAITKYLRSNIHYEKKVPNVPYGRDLVDWLVFDWKKGFCTYYASAEVVLLRAAGIPARIAVGYAQGQRIGSTPNYQVRSKDSHAWPEVYFNGIGWVVFEPTVIYSSLKYFSENSNNDASLLIPEDGGVEVPIEKYRIPPNESKETTESSTISLPKDYTVLIISIGIILIFFTIFRLLLLINYRRMKVRSLPGYILRMINNRAKEPPSWLKKWAAFEEVVPVEKYFRSIMNAGRKMGIQIKVAQTPQENINILVSAIPETKAPAKIFLREYEHALFSKKHPNMNKAKKSARKIRNLIMAKTISNYFSDEQHKVK